MLDILTRKNRCNNSDCPAGSLWWFMLTSFQASISQTLCKHALFQTTPIAQEIACRSGALWRRFRKTWLAPVTFSCASSPTTSTESLWKRAAVVVTIWKRCSKQISRGLEEWLRCWTLGINPHIWLAYGPSTSSLWLPQFRLRRFESPYIVLRNSDHLHFLGK